jgi:hypothetical protein
MMKRTRHIALLFAVVVLLTRCEFTNDLSPLKNGQCPSGKKACVVDGGNACVDKTDPETSCQEQTCLPCSARLYHVKDAICDPNAGCVISTCEDGWAHCTMDRLSGCETNVGTDRMNCGSCGNVCNDTVTNAVPVCTPPGNCTLLCKHGFHDCDGLYSDGCEVSDAMLMVDPKNCGQCGVRCAAGMQCVAGACR